MILSHVVACSQNRVIGSQKALPWHIPEDFEFFKNKTKGHIIIMGRKTFESLPGLLPQRLHIVISRNHQVVQTTLATFKPKESSPVSVVSSLEDALALAENKIPAWPEEVFIIGGGEIYRQSLPLTQKVFLTILHQNFEGDTTYPELDLKAFTITEKRDRRLPIPFTFLTYERRELHPK